MPISEKTIIAKLSSGELDYTVHAIFEAAQDLFFVDEIETALLRCEIIENDEERSRCLVCGRLPAAVTVHVVLDYADWLVDPQQHLVAVTVYRPDPDVWIDGRIRNA